MTPKFELLQTSLHASTKYQPVLPDFFPLKKHILSLICDVADEVEAHEYIQCRSIKLSSKSVRFIHKFTCIIIRGN